MHSRELVRQGANTPELREYDNTRREGLIAARDEAIVRGQTIRAVLVQSELLRLRPFCSADNPLPRGIKSYTAAEARLPLYDPHSTEFLLPTAEQRARRILGLRTATLDSLSLASTDPMNTPAGRIQARQVYTEMLEQVSSEQTAIAVDLTGCYRLTEVRPSDQHRTDATFTVMTSEGQMVYGYGDVQTIRNHLDNCGYMELAEAHDYREALLPDIPQSIYNAPAMPC